MHCKYRVFEYRWPACEYRVNGIVLRSFWCKIMIYSAFSLLYTSYLVKYKGTSYFVYWEYRNGYVLCQLMFISLFVLSANTKWVILCIKRMQWCYMQVDMYFLVILWKFEWFFWIHNTEVEGNATSVRVCQFELSIFSFFRETTFGGTAGMSEVRLVSCNRGRYHTPAILKKLTHRG